MAANSINNIVSSRDQLIKYVKRKLGWPVHNLELDDDQINERIDDAIQFMQDYHSEASEKVYISHRMSNDDIQQRYIDMTQISGVANTVPGSNTVIGTGTLFTQELSVGKTIKIGDETHTVVDIANANYLTTQSTFTNGYNGYAISNMTDAYSIIAVNRIFPLSSALSTVNMFDMRYQMRLHDIYDFTSTSYVNYVITQQHIRTLDLLFTGETPIRFNRHMNRLYLDFNWGKSVTVDEFIVIEATRIVNPNIFTDLFNDRLFKKLCVAYVKLQWGTNLKKFNNVQLLDGISLNGKEVYDEAKEEIKEIEDLIETTMQEPPTFFMG